MTNPPNRRRRAIAGLALGVLVTGGWWLAAPVELGGRSAYVTTRGISMEPRFHTGDLAILRPAGSYRVGDVVGYHSGALKTVVMHRIVAEDHGRYTFKGDNNGFLDPEQPTRDQLIGSLAMRVPQGGVWLKRLTSPAPLALLAFGLLASGGAAAETRHTRRKRPTVFRHAAQRARPAPTLGRAAPTLGTLPAPLRQAATATAAVGVAGLALGAVAWTGPLARETTSEAKTSRSVTFGYSATVPLTAAYDGTTVHSPDPVFRKLARTVAVHYIYRGAPGTVAVAAELSLPDGWHSTVPLTGRTAFTTGTYAGDVRLDLRTIEARSQAAAAVTGLSAEQISISVVPKVVTADGTTFAPALALRLTRIALGLAGDEKTLTVADSTPVTTVATAPRRLHLLGRSLAVASARTASAVMTLGALLATVLLTSVARTMSPRSEGAGIRRRYAPLLIPVQPMPTPAGRPLVDVTAFATLAKLAERYGLLVMHWTRGGVETFVVQDDATTFRYRTGSAAAATAAPDAEAAGGDGAELAALDALTTRSAPRRQAGLGRVAQVVALTCGIVRVCHVMRCSPRSSGLG